jgi:hypothetical protein
MSACHVKPFVLPGVVIEPADDARTHQAAPQDSCDYCGSTHIEWRKCKLICTQCHQINKSCADL